MVSPEQEDRLLREIRKARPVADPSAEEWAESERAQRVLGGVLAGGRDEAHAAPAAMRRRKVLLVAASVAAVFVAGVVVAVVMTTNTGSSAVVQAASTTVSDPSETQDSALVTKSQAVQNIMLLSLSWTQHLSDVVGTPEVGEAELLAAAAEEGLIASGEVTADSFGEPMDEGEYVVLLWRSFGSFFPDIATDDGTTFDAATPKVSAPEGYDTELAAALHGLERVGVIREGDGTFVPERPLSTEREQLLLTRMDAALRGAN